MTSVIPAPVPASGLSPLRQRYRKDGFYISSTSVLPAATVEAATTGMDAIRRGEYDTGRPPCGSPWNPGDDPNKLCKIEQPQFASRGVMDLVSHPSLGQLAAELTGAKWVQVWWVQLLYKPPISADYRTNIGYHQDRAYWGSWEEESELFTAWVAVSDVGENCGPMKFVRGSHRWGLRKEGDFFAQELEAQRSALGVPEGEQWEEVSAILPAGGASFHDCLTIHGSGPNHSDRPRRSFAIHLRTENSRPVDDRREGLTTYIDDHSLCPVIYQAK